MNSLKILLMLPATSGMTTPATGTKPEGVAASLPPAHKRQQRSLNFRMISMFILLRVNGRVL